MMVETYNTSLNQIPAIVKKYKSRLTGTILNYGCGRGWRKVEYYLFAKGTHVHPYDKYGDKYLSRPKVGNFDNIICANVLNVCDSSLLEKTVEDLHAIMFQRDNCTLYISVYEGDRTGIGCMTTKGYQRNEKAVRYESLLNSNFVSVERKGNNFICSNARGWYRRTPKKETPMRDTSPQNIFRTWAMPNSETFSIKPIKELIGEYVEGTNIGRPVEWIPKVIVDPFVRNSPFKDKCLSNDLDPDIEANYHMDALEFLKSFVDGGVDLLLFDPPYSPRQVSECYKKMDKTVNMQTTQSSFWGNLKKEIARIMAPRGVVISCGWNSGGIGKTLGFSIDEILLVPHGGWHNDTIVTVERKLQ